MSHTVHGAKGLHKQAAIDHKAVAHQQQRHEHIAVTAYFHAEHRGFTGDDQLADWLVAEAEIDAALDQDKDPSIV
ncbi:MAG: DUF2934 domain-containing protein [Gallionella sp.]|nr:DUF2934 domain-containing protein [Gallionella sp.]